MIPGTDVLLISLCAAATVVRHTTARRHDHLTMEPPPRMLPPSRLWGPRTDFCTVQRENPRPAFASIHGGPGFPPAPVGTGVAHPACGDRHAKQAIHQHGVHAPAGTPRRRKDAGGSCGTDRLRWMRRGVR